MNKKIIFIHGYEASSKVNFYPEISKMLEAEGIEYSVPDLPGGKNPKAEEWLAIIDQEVKRSDKPVVLVGHSLGTRAIQLFLDKHEPKNVDTVLMIAAFNNDCEKNRLVKDEHFENFWQYPVDIEKVKRSASHFIVMHSKDDHSIPYAQGVEISEALNAKLLTYQDRGHFNHPSNAEEIYKVIVTI